ncbi:5-methylcytosine restriction system specificity protein McrC [Modestobacter sp. SYSU DS0657]
MVALQRLTVREARDEHSVVRSAATGLGVPDAEVLGLLDPAARRLRELLRLRSSPFATSPRGTLRVDGIAGLVRLSPDLELQVAPKFLDPVDPGWQEDFFLLAVFSKTGRILPREQIRAGHGRREDLATLVAQTLAQLFWENHRRPIRSYRTREVQEFAYEGDVDPIDLFVPPPDGWPQRVLQLRRDNEHNAVLAGAVRALLPEVRDSETRHQLVRVQQAIGHQPPVTSLRPVRLPSRYRQWQVAYDLSLQVLRGFGVQFEQEHLLTPGFILRTWETWQALIEAALRTGMPGDVLGQKPYRLGDRSASPLDVTPDVVVVVDGAPALVVDAKYRTREGTTPAVAAGDIYETLAFMRATGTTSAVLLYPRPSDAGSAMPVGSVEVFEQVAVGAERIVALTVECRGISATDGYGQFASRLCAAVQQYVV